MVSTARAVPSLSGLARGVRGATSVAFALSVLPLPASYEPLIDVFQRVGQLAVSPSGHARATARSTPVWGRPAARSAGDGGCSTERTSGSAAARDRPQGG